MAFILRKPPSLSAKLAAYPYQLDAVRAIEALPYAAIFHEQGLGKTKIAIDVMLLWLERDIVDTIFVITKKTLVHNWQQEVVAHSHITPSILSGDRRANSLALNSPVLLYIMNYEVISSNLELIRQFLGTCRVAAFLDESQKIKNPDAAITVCLHSIANCFNRRVIVTGTPVANRPYDIWSQIKFLDDGQSLGTSFSEFKAKYDVPRVLSSPSSYASTLATTMKRIDSFSVRETKASAGLELPSKKVLLHSADLAERQGDIYCTYRNKLRYEIKEHCIDDAEEVLKRLLRLVQCASNPLLVDKSYDEVPGKYPILEALLCDVGARKQKAIVWTNFVDNSLWLVNRLTHYCPRAIHGRMGVDERSDSIRQFKNDQSCRVLVATPGAAKEGLTLTEANHVIFFDRSFSLDDYLQAQDRIHRISQSADCFVHNLIGRNTIDEWVDTLLSVKYHAAAVTQGDMEPGALPEYDLRQDLARILESDS